MTNYKELEAWKVSMSLVERRYKHNNNYPNDEIFGLRSQTRRAVVSIPSNIAEGLGRRGSKECGRFLNIPRGSGHEVDTLICIAKDIGILTVADFDDLEGRLPTVLRLLNGLIRHYEIKPQ